MRRTARIRRGCLWALVGVAVLIALVPWRGIIWDGRFPAVECRMKFVDGEGKPVPGVTLTVLTKAGGRCHFYPVDEFVPDRPVVSDAEGRMVFHHTPIFLEFAGHEYSNLVGMRFGETSAPHYDCVFTHGEREVFRTPYNFHRHEWDGYRQPSVTRALQPPWDVTMDRWSKDEDWRQKLFDTNHDGVIDREEATAANYFSWRCRDVRPDNTAEQTYIVVERTIVIPNP